MDFTPNNSYKITYIDKEGNETIRKITFIRNFRYRENTYLEAFCHLRKDHRNFISSSIISSEILLTKKRKVVKPRYDEKKWSKAPYPKPVPEKEPCFAADLVMLAIKTIVVIPFALLGMSLGASRGMGKSTAVFGESKHDWYHSQSGKKDQLYRVDS